MGERANDVLHGALFVLQRDAMSLVAPDGHRLALVTVPREPAQGERLEGEETGAIWPRKTLSRACGQLDLVDGRL
jgi:DNA polymerase III sliding clamp (beta) subunit (PCNA family)